MANKTKSSIAHAPNVTLRKMKIKKGFTLYLDIYSNGKRTKEYLHLQVTGNKDLDKETIELAKKIYAKRIQEIQSEQHGEFNWSKINSNFVDFFEENALKRPMRDKRKSNKWTNTLNYIKEYSGDKLSFNQVTSEWLDGFKEFLISKLKRNSAATYYETSKASLNYAVRNRILKENPCNFTDNITLSNPEGFKIEIFNSLGERVDLILVTQYEYPEVRINVSSLKPGIYFLKAGDKLMKFIKL